MPRSKLLVGTASSRRPSAVWFRSACAGYRRRQPCRRRRAHRWSIPGRGTSTASSRRRRPVRRWPRPDWRGRRGRPAAVRPACRSARGCPRKTGVVGGAVQGEAVAEPEGRHAAVLDFIGRRTVAIHLVDEIHHGRRVGRGDGGIGEGSASGQHPVGAQPAQAQAGRTRGPDRRRCERQRKERRAGMPRMRAGAATAGSNVARGTACASPWSALPGQTAGRKPHPIHHGRERGHEPVDSFDLALRTHACHLGTDPQAVKEGRQPGL